MKLLRLQSIEKSFGGTVALMHATFELAAGEALGVIGENGAGKSTLIKILSGVHSPDAGAIFWNGQAARFADPHRALAAGIATIHQELACFDKLTVSENLLMGEPWPRHRWGAVNWPALHAEARRRLERCGLTLDPRALFHALSPAQRQEVAIARALSRNARLLILDEPSASLTEPEVVRLLDHLRRLKREGVALIYVSHRLDEILSITDQLIVLRDGVLVARYPTREATVQRMVRDMVGRELTVLGQRHRGPPGEPVFSAARLSHDGLFRDISFTIHAGEIVGLAGLIGAGRSEFARAIFGLYPSTSGSMRLRGAPYAPRNPAEARALGVAYVPEERKRHGFVLDHSLQSGVSISLLDALSRFGWVRPAAERLRVAGAVARLGVKARGLNDPVGSLSGGNQQKALLARWLETDPRLIVLDEPTRGVDVGAKAEIHKLIDRLATEGKAILLISSDLPELLALSDRILVLHRGAIAAEFGSGDATQEKILLAASGCPRPGDPA